jgi:hypothetical protein
VFFTVNAPLDLFVDHAKMPQTIINLAEQTGKEGACTKAYRDYMNELNMKDAVYAVFKSS